MITSAVSFRAALREPQPPLPPTGHESPHDARDAGWLGQVPPPDAAPMPRPATAIPDGTLPVTGHESVHDAREAGWLGQVPPPDAPPARTTPTTPRAGNAIEFGTELPHERLDDGWLGQVPPPSAPPASVDDAPTTTYANPQLAPEAWKDSGSLFPDDPTLFG